ncbi:alpha-L-rhamnosidase [Arthrobacter sp. ZBG10]|uniref:alpha-L-rhamnosidase n=1 Tax=Arthrobacter sp. ZBG10 TaxID=1676590 RepID=UPI0006A4AABD|nr:alpha-L-rhamnosidase [Arthrobacter sp. ZBG10]KNH17885.1 alpha-L-rhamnosidase [Arthrobacter sp. ZBG10]
MTNLIGTEASFTAVLEGARWIRPNEPADPGPGARPAYVLRLDVELPDDVDTATLAATAHGIIEVFLNGRRIGDEELVPGFTAYRKRLQVFEWDVAGYLHGGSNSIEVLLSDGWFRGRHGFERRANGFGAETALLLGLQGMSRTGTPIRVVSDAAWRSAPSHIVRADLMDGQSVDFRRLDDGGCFAGPWSPALPATGGLYDDRSRLIPAAAQPVRRIETLAAVAVTSPKPGTAVVDFGQNLNGWVRLSALGPKDTRLVLTHGETLDGEGMVSTENLRAFNFATGDLLPAGQVDEVISAGRPGDVFEPRHTTHGFRYVQVEGLPGLLSPGDICAVVVHSDLAPAGSFSCSDRSLNALHTAGVWSFRGNACEIPTDCPQRERSGFTGDWQVFVSTAALLYDVRAFSDKWLADLAADQWADGRVPTITPNPAGDQPSGVVFEDLSAGSAGWGDAAVLVPWELWRAYGDKGILRRQLPSMQAWVDYASRAAAASRHPARAELRPTPESWEAFLWDTGFHFGEWLEPGVRPAPDPSADHSIVATAFLHRSAFLLAASAKVLGEPEIEAKYAAIAAGALTAWRREFLTDIGLLSLESQANYARGLAFGLFPVPLRDNAAARLGELVSQNNGRLGTGFLSTGQLLPALADHGRAEQAYSLLQSTGFPSWLGMLENGATTVWEWWNGVSDGDVRGSLNHYSKAAVLSFLYTHVAGIRLGEQPTEAEAAYRHVTIAPVPGGGLGWARASLATTRGPLSSAWRIVDSTFILDIEVPPGTRARIELPDGAVLDIGAGQRTFSVPLHQSVPA